MEANLLLFQTVIAGEHIKHIEHFVLS